MGNSRITRELVRCVQGLGVEAASSVSRSGSKASGVM